MRLLKYILRWALGTVLAVYLALAALFYIPACQRWLTGRLSAVLGQVFQTEVSVGGVRISLDLRVVANDVRILDQQGQPFLSATRLGARIGLWDLLHDRIRLSAVQVFGLKANMYQTEPDADPNFLFFVRALQSKDTTSHTPLDLSISSIHIRRADVSWHRRWMPVRGDEGTLASLLPDPNHVDVKRLAVNARLETLTDDSLSVTIRRLDFTDEQSGFAVNGLSFALTAGRQGALLTGFQLDTSLGQVDIPQLAAAYDADAKRLLDVDLALTAHAALPQVAADADVRLTGRPDSLELQLKGSQVTVPSLDLQVYSLALTASVLDLPLGVDSLRAVADISDAQFSLSDLRFQGANSLGVAQARGTASLLRGRAAADLDVTSALGSLALSGTATPFASPVALDVSLSTPGFDFSPLTSGTLGPSALTLSASGRLGHPLHVTTQASLLTIRGTALHSVSLDATADPSHIKTSPLDVRLAVNDPRIHLDGTASASPSKGEYSLQASLQGFRPNDLGLTQRYPDTEFSGNVTFMALGLDFRHSTDHLWGPDSPLEGFLHVNDFTMLTPDTLYSPGDLHASFGNLDDEQYLSLVSPFLEADVRGACPPSHLVADARQLLSTHIPTLVTPAGTARTDSTDYLTFSARLHSVEPLRQLMGLDLSLPQTAVLQGTLDMPTSTLTVSAQLPSVLYGNEDLRDISVRLENYPSSLFANVQLERLMKGTYVTLGAETRSQDNGLDTRLFWDNNRPVPLEGDVHVVAQFLRDSVSQYYVKALVEPSEILTADSTWQILPGSLSWHAGVLDVDSFAIRGSGHSLSLQGRASKEETDTLRARLHRVDLDNIFSFINFNAVEFTGEATGDVAATSLFSSPHADVNIQVPDFRLNGALMGDLEMYGNWGRQPYSIYLDGILHPAAGQGSGLASPAASTSRIQGYITPKKDVSYHGLDLHIDAHDLNIGFINKYTQLIFDNLTGTGSGWVHLMGPFKALDIEGQVLVHEGSLTLPITGVRYTAINDSVLLTPGNIDFHNADIYDPSGQPGQTEHHATIDGHLGHSHFANLTYDIQVKGDHILGYNIKDFGELPIIGEVIATGDVTVTGSPDKTEITIRAKPEEGSYATYDFTSPEASQSVSELVSFIDHQAELDSLEAGAEARPADTQPAVPEKDLRMHFDLDISSNTPINLLMDARSGDIITAYGHGRILAHIYSMGDILMFGTYHIDSGSYNLSIQEIIRKNFELVEGGTVTFTGSPMTADLNVQATHLVSGVSLNDISARSTFSSTSARVQCIMNVTGKAAHPQLSFDFDILNVNEDEKQMVRSLISTDEERNMQVLYLLGIGRFYTYNYDSSQSQSSTAVNSLLSSTLSGQINSLISNMTGNTNWNFGANLNTGDTGWTDLDVEGMLQGSLFNDRLLINGNFGYRDNAVNSSNFVGDFDARYLINRTGTISLKAYNETNDRYFTKSSLTTQGIGIVLKKDFSTIHDLFRK